MPNYRLLFRATLLRRKNFLRTICYKRFSIILLSYLTLFFPLFENERLIYVKEKAIVYLSLNSKRKSLPSYQSLTFQKVPVSFRSIFELLYHPFHDDCLEWFRDIWDYVSISNFVGIVFMQFIYLRRKKKFMSRPAVLVYNLNRFVFFFNLALINYFL